MQRLQEAASVPAEQHLAGGLRTQHLPALGPHAAAGDGFQRLGHPQRRGHGPRGLGHGSGGPRQPLLPHRGREVRTAGGRKRKRRGGSRKCSRTAGVDWPLPERRASPRGSAVEWGGARRAGGGDCRRPWPRPLGLHRERLGPRDLRAFPSYSCRAQINCSP